MQDGLWKVVFFILVVMLLVIYPTMQLWEMQDRVIQMEITTETAAFLDTVRYSRQINATSLQALNQRLYALDTSLTIELKHKFVYWVPVVNENGAETGEAKEAFMQIGNEEILERLYNAPGNASIEETTYTLSEGDWFEITIKNSRQTNAQKLRALLLGVQNHPFRFYVKLNGFIH